MGRIAREAGVPKGTLYVYFDRKEALFRAVVVDLQPSTAERLADLDRRHEGLETALSSFAARLLAEVLEPGHVALLRMVVAVSERFPHIGRTFYEAGPLYGAQRLAEHLTLRPTRGEIALDGVDPQHAAWHFLGLIKNPLSLCALMSAAPVRRKRNSPAPGARPRACSCAPAIDQPVNGVARVAKAGRSGQPSLFTKAATASPMAAGESSWMKWEPGTVTSVCAGQVRQKSRALPRRMDPGSALMKSLGTGLAASQAP
ncbi:MAG: hypothetical protein CML46_01610 [Rhodobacteraceae bacterium]|nr:hypothetical protein [Paracoccaceae bacterium]